MEERSTCLGLPGHKRHSRSGRDKYKQLITELWLMVCKCFMNGLASSSVVSECLLLTTGSASLPQEGQRYVLDDKIKSKKKKVAKHIIIIYMIV